jgi:hypothetical protein
MGQCIDRFAVWLRVKATRMWPIVESDEVIIRIAMEWIAE